MFAHGQFFVKVQFLKALIPKKACGLDYILVVVLSTVILNFHYQLNSSIRVCKDVFFRDCYKVYEVHVYENNGKGSAANKYCHASLLFVDSKIMYFQIMYLLITSKNVSPFLNFSMVSSLFDQLQIFQQMYLIELVGIFIGLGLLNLLHLIYPRLLLKFLTKSSFIEIQIKYSAIFHIFLVIDRLEQFWLRSFCKKY